MTIVIISVVLFVLIEAYSRPRSTLPAMLDLTSMIGRRK